MSQKPHPNRFPGESPRYRTARNRLLAAETDLRRQVERVARMRRKLPLGGQVAEDYVFDEPADAGSIRQVKLSESFRAAQRSKMARDATTARWRKHNNV